LVLRVVVEEVRAADLAEAAGHRAGMYASDITMARIPTALDGYGLSIPLLTCRMADLSAPNVAGHVGRNAPNAHALTPEACGPDLMHYAPRRRATTRM
jgi:hypothetical protein